MRTPNCDWLRLGQPHRIQSIPMASLKQKYTKIVLSFMHLLCAYIYYINWIICGSVVVHSFSLIASRCVCCFNRVAALKHAAGNKYVHIKSLTRGLLPTLSSWLWYRAYLGVDHKLFADLGITDDVVWIVLVNSSAAAASSVRGLPFGAVPSHLANKHVRHRMQCARVSTAASKGIPNQ